MLPLSPLLAFAINLNQWITDSIYRHHSVLYWDIPTRKFQAESQPQKYFMWALNNFVLILGIGAPACVYVLINCLYTPEKYKIFEIFLICIQLSFAIGIVATAVTLWNNASSLSHFYNHLFQFQADLENKFSPEGRRQVRRKRFTKFSKYFAIGFLPSGNIDILGVTSIGIVLAYGVIPFFFPFLTLYIGVDSPYLLLRDIFPLVTRSLVQLILIFLFRSIVVIFCVIEACITFRTMALYAILLLTSVSRCLILLQTPARPLTPHSFRPLTQLRLLFNVANETYSVLASVYLIMMFLLLVLCNTLCCALIPVFHQNWQIYIFGPLIGTLTTVILLTLFALVVSIDDLSKQLHNNWTYACATDKPKTFQLVRKIIRAMKPISFTYSSFGTFKRGTRRDYLYSVVLYSVNSIVAFRTQFYSPI